MTEEEKSNRWKDYLTRINGKSDSREIFRTVRAIDGKYVPRKENEVLEVDGKTYISDRKKAEQFAKTYRKFSKLDKKKEDRKIRKEVRRQWKTNRPLEECEQDLTMKEMVDVIQDANMNKASGSDDIPYEMVKRLGTKAREMLLHLINRCWSGVDIPTKWRIFSIFADDVTILARNRSTELATKEAQCAVDLVSDWSRKWKLTLNASKSEVC